MGIVKKKWGKGKDSISNTAGSILRLFTSGGEKERRSRCRVNPWSNVRRVRGTAEYTVCQVAAVSIRRALRWTVRAELLLFLGVLRIYFDGILA